MSNLTQRAQRLDSIRGHLIMYELMSGTSLREEKKLLEEVQQDLYRLRELEE